MAKREPQEWELKLTDYQGTIRSRIPAPMVRELGGRAGDYIRFRMDETGRVTVSIRRATASEKRKATSRSSRKKK